MALRKFPLIAREGWPFILATALAIIIATRVGGLLLCLPLLGLLLLWVLLFRDPPRSVPSRPLAVVSPVDGRVVEVEPTDKGCLEREAMRIVLRVNHLGAYTARSPAEGKVLNLRDNVGAGSRLLNMSGLWLRTDEDDDIVMLMHGPRWLGRPRAFTAYGERLGQGQRCAFVRLASTAEVFMPLTSKINVRPGDQVRAGSDILGLLVHR